MKIYLGWIFISLIIISCRNSPKNLSHSYSTWETYAGTPDASRYSSHDQINTGNVSKLKVAWRYSTNDKDTGNRSQIQCNPIIIDGYLYGISARLKLFALDAATGQEKWLFDPAVEEPELKNNPDALFKISRGVAYWESEDGVEKRIFFSAGKRTYAINALDGKPVRSFGNNGHIDLSHDLDIEGDPSGYYISATTPGVIYNDLFITGMRVAESEDAAPGHIRAYNVRTGKREWIFHTIPQPGEYGYDSWVDKEAWKYLGGANCWAGLSLDVKRGIVYVPTGSVGGDFYGGFREGTNLFANSLIALQASNGKYLWHYQVIHHDLWDRDLPANPNLVTIKRNGKLIDAVAQITKHGYVFVFDRITGKPVFPVKEMAVPQNALPGEKPWPTQPVPDLPEPFARQKFEENDITNISEESRTEMLEKCRQIANKAMFAPPSKEGSFIFPGFDGGGEWGGASVDPETAILYVNSSELPWTLTMIDIPVEENDRSIAGIGKNVYNQYCIACHGADLKGNGPAYPSLTEVSKNYNANNLKKLIENGKNMMPAFKQIPENEKDALIAFLMKSPLKEPSGALKSTHHQESLKKETVQTLEQKSRDKYRSPFVMTGYNRFLDKNGYPGIKPPWGTLNAIDLNNGKLLWKVPLGEYDELTRKGIPVTGTENYGGPVNTKGGLVFIAATKDSKIRAFDKKNGKMLWEANLPVPGYATPSVYLVNGKQFVVIACGGGKIGSKSGDEYIAFALP